MSHCLARHVIHIETIIHIEAIIMKPTSGEDRRRALPLLPTPGPNDAPTRSIPIPIPRIHEANGSRQRESNKALLKAS
jgi:hypothetical protein